MSQATGIKTQVQKLGRALSGMVMPNIGAFIAWGFITALFIEKGWWPNAQLAEMVTPMLKYVLPVLIGYTGGKMIAGDRGSVIGAIATVGIVVGAGDTTMLIGGMIMGPLAGWVIKKFDELVDGKIPSGFEMLVNNFSVGILGLILAIIGFYAIGPVVIAITSVLQAGVEFLVKRNLIFLTSVFIEPAKVLFLNNAINHGILSPLGIEQAKEMGASIMFLLEANPGPGLGVLLAYCLFGKGASKESAPGAVIIHFLGGIHEIYFPYILMNPALILAVILGGASGVLTFSVLGAGLVAAASPGSILAILAMTAKGKYFAVIAGVVVATVVSFLVSSVFVKRAASRDEEQDLSAAQAQMKDMKAQSKNQKTEGSEVAATKEVAVSDIKKIVFACDAGMGSSAMGAARFKARIKDLGLGIEVEAAPVDNVPEDAQIIVTHESLAERAKAKYNNIEIIEIKNFLKDENIDTLYSRLANSGSTQSINTEVAATYDTKDISVSDIKKIIFACDAGMGSSAMGAAKFKARIKDLGLGIEVAAAPVDNIPADAQIVVTHESLAERAKAKYDNIEIIEIKNFLKDENIEDLYNKLASSTVKA
ncbi:PTS mannitol-specific transporter subunit IIBC [Intestinibacter sp.]|uniref:PTS mannitol-specific transporter subunit IIBC n=1 Tax=Intestinibacter sp. TaxID=1965304 RepID=UPI002A9167A5|nr:PTS mannitol transporter subunit IICBA [Intestinibacter sp.]MDY5211386.1 PTS mannitol transporter subunit IICBA [Intestinibacter sp.]